MNLKMMTCALAFSAAFSAMADTHVMDVKKVYSNRTGEGYAK